MRVWQLRRKKMRSKARGQRLQPSSFTSDVWDFQIPSPGYAVIIGWPGSGYKRDSLPLQDSRTGLHDAWWGAFNQPPKLAKAKKNATVPAPRIP